MEVSPFRDAYVAIYGAKDHKVNLLGRDVSQQKSTVAKQVICFVTHFKLKYLAASKQLSRIISVIVHVRG